MSKCKNCGYDNPPDNRFCGNCGAQLPSEELCASCGAPLSPDAAFCGKCGTPKSKRCATCGAALSPDAAFCFNCGSPVSGAAKPAPQTAATPAYTTPVNAQPAPNCANAPKKSAKQSFVEAKSKVAAFEKKHCVIINGIIAVLAFIFIFVSLFAPVRMIASDPTMSFDDSMESKYAEGSVIEIDQSIWQVMGSVKYVSLDINDSSDRKLIQEVYADYSVAYKSVLSALSAWRKTHQFATEDAVNEKYAELFEKYMSDINLLAFQFVFTTVGALDYLVGEEVEKEMEAALIAQRNTAVLALVMALITAAVQIGIAIVSLVFLILAIIGMVRKKQSKLFGYLLTALIMSGAGLAVLSVSPLLSAGGAMFAVALMTALAFFGCAIGKAVMTDKGLMFIVKRATCSALSLIAFFMLCSNILSYHLIQSMNDVNVTQVVTGPLGMAFESIFTVLDLNSVEGVTIGYSDASIASCVAVLAIGLIAFSVLFAAMVKSFTVLANKTEQKPRIDVLSLVGVIALIAFATTPAIIAAADSMPVTDNGLGFGTGVATMIKFVARAFVYVAMAFAIAAFVLELAFRPKNAKSYAATVAPQQSGGAAVQAAVGAQTNNPAPQSAEADKNEHATIAEETTAPATETTEPVADAPSDGSAPDDEPTVTPVVDENAAQ